MFTKGKLLACLVGIAPLLLTPTVASADEQLSLTTIVSLPDGQLLRSFDISFVSPTNHVYTLAASATVGGTTGPATNPAIIIVDTRLNVVTKELHATPTFAGSCSLPPATGTE